MRIEQVLIIVLIIILIYLLCRNGIQHPEHFINEQLPNHDTNPSVDEELCDVYGGYYNQNDARNNLWAGPNNNGYGPDTMYVSPAPNKDGPGAYPWGSDVAALYAHNKDLMVSNNNGDLYQQMDMDETIARTAYNRQHDRRAHEGYTIKNANYYKRHFGNELDESEAQEWWGEDEY
jgi:hypothetical protein